MNRSRFPGKWIISLIAFIVLIVAWQIIRERIPIRPNTTSTIAPGLLPDSGRSVQLGAQLSPEAVEIGNFATLTVVLRNNETTAVKPKVTIQLPTSLRFEEMELDESVLFNAAEQALYWYPDLAASGGIS